MGPLPAKGSILSHSLRCQKLITNFNRANIYHLLEEGARLHRVANICYISNPDHLHRPTLAQFVRLLNINSRTAYKIEERKETFNPEYHFFLRNGNVNPFTRLNVWHHLNDTSQVCPLAPTVCSPDTDLHCVVYCTCIYISWR